MPKRFRTYFWPYMALTAHIRSILLCPFLGAAFLMVTVSQPILNLQLVQLSVSPFLCWFYLSLFLPVATQWHNVFLYFTNQWKIGICLYFSISFEILTWDFLETELLTRMCFIFLLLFRKSMYYFLLLLMLHWPGQQELQKQNRAAGMRRRSSWPPLCGSSASSCLCRSCRAASEKASHSSCSGRVTQWRKILLSWFPAMTPCSPGVRGMG